MSRTIASDAALAGLTFVAFDLETTGCSPGLDRAVEMGAARFDLAGRDLGTFSELVHPGRPIPANVVRVHGITDADVRHAPPFADVLPRFAEFLGDCETPPVLLAHNARFDMGFVGAGLARAGLPAPPHPVVDTVRLSRRRMPAERSHSLRNCARRFGVAETTDHRGLSDSLVLKAVFLNLLRRPPAVETFGQLDALCGCGPIVAGRLPGTRTNGGRPAAPRRSRRYDPPAGENAKLTAAIAAKRAVTILYDGGTKGAGARSITPSRMRRRGGELYLFAWCHADGREKQYRVDRIRSVLEM